MLRCTDVASDTYGSNGRSQEISTARTSQSELGAGSRGGSRDRRQDNGAVVTCLAARVADRCVSQPALGSGALSLEFFRRGVTAIDPIRNGGRAHLDRTDERADSGDRRMERLGPRSDG